MKNNKLIFTVIFTIIIVTLAMKLNAQTSIQPFDAVFEFDHAQRPCIQVNLDPEPNTLKKAWKDYLKDNYDFKLRGIGFFSNKDLLTAEAIVVKQISSKTMDFYTHIVEDANGSVMTVFVRYGYDIYLTKENSPSEYMALHEIIESFLKYYLPIYYQGEIEDTQKRVTQLTKISSNLKSDISDDSKTIEKLRKEIQDLEEKTASNNKQLEIENLKLEKRNEKLDRIRKQLIKL
jgi:hypothetical protein